MKGEPIYIHGVEKRFSDKPVVSDVSLNVSAGEFVSLLGPSGSGKTTLLMMIAGFEMPDAGHIAVGSRDITYLAPNKRNVGMVFQRYALFPHMTVAQNIAFPLRMRGYKSADIRNRIADMLSLVQLSGFADRYPQQLSGGQQQRVAVARALVAEPPVLLMDEPLSALDKKLRETMQIEIKRIQQRVGVTVIYVTHDQEEALTMSDRVAVMSDGRLVQVGTPLDLYQDPRSPFVAEFIGKMNFLNGEYLGQGTETFSIRISEQAVLQPLRSSLQQAANDPRSGDRLRVAVRPEHVAVRPAGASPREMAGLAGTIEAAIFVGAAQIVLVGLDGLSGEPIQALIPAQLRMASLAAGDRVEVDINPAAIRLFTAAEGVGR